MPQFEVHKDINISSICIIGVLHQLEYCKSVMPNELVAKQPENVTANPNRKTFGYVGHIVKKDIH